MRGRRDVRTIRCIDPATDFLRLACLTYEDDGPHRWEQARTVLRDHPDIAGASIHVAAAVADADLVRRHLSRDGRLARAEGGPFGWEPLLYLAYARHDAAVERTAVLATAAVLLDAGADPNAGYLKPDLPTPFTALTGAFGEGELGPVAQPRHPHSLPLARLLLDAGADPNDGQALYNRMFLPDDDHLELLFEHGLGTGDGGPWKARMGAALESPAEMVRRQLSWAITHEMTARVELLADNGADLSSPLDDGSTPTEVAARNGNGALVELLVKRGAAPPAPSPVDALVGAALAADRAGVARVQREHPDVVAHARAERPGLMVWATALGRADTVRLLAELGFDVNARGRGDVPLEQPWETALHQAVSRGDRALVELLLVLGADTNVRDERFESTPLGWAHHFEHPDLVELLEPLTVSEA